MTKKNKTEKKEEKKRTPLRRIPGSRTIAPALCSPEGEITFSVFDYDEKEQEYRCNISLEDVREYRRKPGTVTWINIDGLCQPGIIEQVGKIFDIHDLTVEDILHVQERPKIDFFEEYIYIALRMISYQAEDRSIKWETVSIVLGKNFLLTFQEPGEDLFDPIRRRLKNPSDRLRRNRTDFLAYSLLDTIVDNYFYILEKIGDEIEDLEDEVLLNADPALLKRIHHLKREVIFLRKSVWPVREIISAIEQRKPNIIKKDTFMFLRDVYDHITQIIETVETYRDMLTGILDVYLSSVNNRLNEVVKVLTIISVIFMPLTFLTGFYGMNFEYIPMMKTTWGYAALLGIMGVSISVMLAYFKRRNWL